MEENHNLKVIDARCRWSTVSKSVAAGQPLQEKPMMLRAAESISPRIPGKLLLAGK